MILGYQQMHVLKIRHLLKVTLAPDAAVLEQVVQRVLPTTTG